MVQTLTNSLNNELNSDKFKLVFNEIKNAELLCVNANVPGISGQPIEIGNKINKLFVQGNKLNYEPLSLTFKVDEDLTSYMEIHRWMVGIYSPQDLKQFADFQNRLKMPLPGSGTKFGFDATLLSLTNSSNPNVELFFTNLFPTNLSSIDLSIGSSEVILATATFQFDYFQFRMK